MHRTYREAILNYTSPTTVLCAVFFFAAFAKLSSGKRTALLINFFAPTTFSVYLIHGHPLIRDAFISGSRSQIAEMNPAPMLLSVIGIGLGIFLICSLIDQIRRGLFCLLKVSPRLSAPEDRITEKLNARFPEITK